jgi:hypothetical protein
MSRVAGEFDETILLQQQHMADKMMLDDRIRQQFIPQYNIFKYLQSLQTATVNSAFNTRSKKNYDVEVSWVNACSNFDIEDVSCVIGGDELSTNVEEYVLDHRFVKGFTVRDDVMRNNHYETQELIAKGLLKIDKEITEDFAQFLIGRLNTYAGINVVPNVAPGIVVNGNTTEIQAALWVPAIMAYFARTTILNRFTQPALLSGNNLFETLFVAQANAANADGKGDYTLWNGMPIWFDLFNVDSVNAPDFFTYMVSQGALAMANKAWNPDSPYRSMSDIRYTMQSRFMPGMKYDVYYTNNCIAEADLAEDHHQNVAPNRDALGHHWKVVLTADMFLNPEGCEEDNTGVLRFENV